jgi:hypothetical protein
MTPHEVPTDPAQLHDNIIDLQMAIEDATARLDPKDLAAVTELASLSESYRLHLAALKRLETVDAL